MYTEVDKENIADGLSVAVKQSPKKPTRKTRNSTGGIGASPLKENAGNRRKSAFVPAVKSEAELQRREARRKSLANRRVSFAPEATLHTWDVIEYMRDATTSSASSNSTRRASEITQASSIKSPQTTAQSPAGEFDSAEPPSTPPEQVEEPLPTSSPANQRDLHQRKRRRRSSGIPPMNFNNPEDAYSSSPISGSDAAGSDEIEPESDDGGSTAMSLDVGDITGRTSASDVSEAESTGSSAKLDEALRQAAVQAGTQRIDFDENGDLTMEMAGDEITAAFKPWIQKSLDDQEKLNPFSPAFKVQALSALSGTHEDSVIDENEDMSMEVTMAVGGILSSRQLDAEDVGDATMDLTTAVGRIKPAVSQPQPPLRSALKRRRSSTIEDPFVTTGNARGSPAKRQASRRNSVRRRRSSAEESSPGDETMDLTVAVGAIKGHVTEGLDERRASVDTSLGEEGMDFTMVVGGIKEVQFSAQTTNATPKREVATVVTPQKQSPAKAANKAKPTPNSAQKESPAKTVLRERTPNKATPQKQTPTKPASPKRLSTQHIPPVPTPVKNTMDLTNSIKLLSTPRKQILTSPMKGAPTPTPRKTATPLRDPTPKRTPLPKREVSPRKVTTPKKTPTPKKGASPRKVTIDAENLSEDELSNLGNAPTHVDGSTNDASAVEEQIRLQEFLDMTNIRFMDLTTTKRRPTGFPTAKAGLKDEDGDEEVDSKPTLESLVVAAACTVPELEMYQHSCRELKKDISDGRIRARQIEEDVYESNPALFREYLSAPPEEKHIMDNQFKLIKANARLQSKALWYGWRSQLLNDLKTALLKTSSDFDLDDQALKQQEELVEATLPELIARHEQLETDCQLLRERADELASCDQQELDAARERLITADAQITEKKALLEALQKELQETETTIETVEERKLECAEEIKAAEKVREECRGWSASEVNAIRARVEALEAQFGWSVASASTQPNTLTLVYRGDLQLFFHPSAFAQHNKDSSGGHEARPNSPISLTYIRDDAPITTSKRFMLQNLRAHLHSIEQSSMSTAGLLHVVARGWDTALAIAEGMRLLEQSFVTVEAIQSDERMAITAKLLLPTLQTKVKAAFELSVTVGHEGVDVDVNSRVTVVYGEKYDEIKMSEFLKTRVGEEVKSIEKMGVWAEAVRELQGRLLKRGRKG